MLSDRCLSCLSVCLSVTLVYCGQTVGWIKMPLGAKVGLGPGHIVLDGTQLPQKRGAAAPCLCHFSTHVYCGQTAELLLTLIFVFRPHRRTTYIDAAYCYRRSSVVCRSITIVSPAKRLNRSKCCLGCGLKWAGGTMCQMRDPWEGAISRGERAAHCKVH